MSNLQIHRIYEYEEIKRVRDLLAEEWPLEEQDNSSETREILSARTKILNGDLYVYSGFVNDELVCTCTVVAMPVLRGDKFIQIESVVVKKEHRGKGYGATLIEKVI